MSLEIKEIINKIERHPLGDVHALLAINKPIGVTSHDMVASVRRKLNTKKVGHAGALDPFASGVLLVLVGRFTKLSDKLMLSTKKYKTRIIFGLSTDTQDREGKVLEFTDVVLSDDQIKETLQSFEGGYEQYVSIYSSVKVNGRKLREIARKSKSIKVNEMEDKKIAVFEVGDTKIEIEIPKKFVEIESIELVETGVIKSKDLDFYKEEDKNFTYADIVVKVSKGTYIRQLAEDLGDKLKVPAMLGELERISVGEINIEDCIEIDSLRL